jgi:hypothetical protein
LQVSVEWINIQLSTNSGEATGNQFHGEKLWNIQFFNLKRMWTGESLSLFFSFVSERKHLIFEYKIYIFIYIFCFRSLLFACVYNNFLPNTIFFSLILKTFLHWLRRCTDIAYTVM